VKITPDHVLTIEKIMAQVPHNWKQQYYDNNGRKWADAEKKVIWERLDRLKSPTPETIAIIIGNDTWTSNRCDQCGKHVDAVIFLGEPLDYYSHTARLCIACVRDAIAAVESVVNNA